MKDNLINKIKILLGIVKQEFKSAKLEDGSEINFDELSVGQSVFDENGDKLLDGDYKLEDGTSFTITESVISDVKEPQNSENEVEVESAEQTETEQTESTETETPKVEVDESETIKRIEQIEQQINDLYEIVMVISQKIKESEAEMENTIEEFKIMKSTPSATPVYFGKEETSPMSRMEKLKKLKIQ